MSPSNYNSLPTQRHIIFFGETSTGKSSAINLILGTGTLTISNDVQPCTRVNARYEVILDDTKYNLWDTRGLGGGVPSSPALGESSKELENFLGERHRAGEIDLLVFCVRGSRVTKTLIKYYNNFCTVTRQLAAPVVIMVTYLENETDMEHWWIKNSPSFNGLGMEFDGYVCITTLSGHRQSAESKKRLTNLITNNYGWEMKETGSYFGSHVPRPAGPFEFPSDCIRRRNDYPIRHGAFGDIWVCDLIMGGSSRMVAVKAVKSRNVEDLESHQKKLRREWKVWWRLQHRNIVPFLGVVAGFGPLPSMVSPWFADETLSRFLARHQRLKMSEKDRLLGDVAAGLCYLHSQDVIHGDLHSDNILIDEQGTACLTDFGLSIINEFVGTPYLRSNICGSIQFADPALVKRANNCSDGVYPTKACDVYSFGGVMCHVASGKKPYDGISMAAVLMRVLQGERPTILTGGTTIPSWYRSTISMCWDGRESKRPTARELVKMFHEHS